MLRLRHGSPRAVTAGSALIASALAASAASAASAPAPALAGVGFQKPSWLTELSLGVKEGYDNNLYFSDVGALSHRESWVTTLSPRIGVNFAPLLPAQPALQVLSVGYTPDVAVYHEETTENYQAHRVATSLKGQAGALSYNLENGFTFIAGGKESPIYLAGRSAYATGAPRERREQFQDRGKINVQYDQEKWFARPTATLLSYDLRTEQRPATGAWKGYDNYADRSDVNGGIDFGYKVQPQLAVTLGYRSGHQSQEQYSHEIEPANLSSPSDYQRVLLGLEGKPWKWLTMAVQGGPDFRRYEPNSATHTSPLNDLSPLKYYGEATLTAGLSAKDTLSFRYRQWQWMSSTGKIPYFDSLYDLSFRRKFNPRLSVEAGGRLQCSDYTSGNAPTSLRDDWQYSLTAGLNYNFTANLSTSLTYLVDLGRNAQEGLSAAVVESREYDHHLICLGAQFKF